MPPGRKMRVRLPADKFHYAAKKRAQNARKGARLSRNLQAEVKKVIEGTQETKLIIGSPTHYPTGQTLENWTSFSSAITSTNEVYNIIPPIAQGTDDFQRIGSSIQPVKMTMKLNVALDNTTSFSGSASIYVDAFIMKAKTVKTATQTANVLTGSLMNNGQGFNVPYDGTSYTAMLPVNKADFVQIKRHRFKLQLVGAQPNSVVGSGVPAQSLSAYTGSLSVNIPLPAKYLYQDSSQTVPTNDFPFLMLGFCATDFYGGISPVTPRIYAQAQTHLYYKDA